MKQAIINTESTDSMNAENDTLRDDYEILAQELTNDEEENVEILGYRKGKPGWEKEIGDDVKSECSQFGKVLHISVDADSKGHVYMKFESVGTAQVAMMSLNGRYFAGKLIEASFIPEGIYKAKFEN